MAFLKRLEHPIFSLFEYGCQIFQISLETVRKPPGPPDAVRRWKANDSIVNLRGVAHVVFRGIVH